MQMAPDFSSHVVSSLNVDFLQKSPHYAAWVKVIQGLKDEPPVVNSGVFTAHEAMQVGKAQWTSDFRDCSSL